MIEQTLGEKMLFEEDTKNSDKGVEEQSRKKKSDWSHKQKKTNHFGAC